jgi:hypothetical protein
MGGNIKKNWLAGMGRGEMHRGFWWGNLKERRPKRRNEENIKIDLQAVGWGRGLF